MKTLLPAVALVLVSLAGCSMQLEYNAPVTSAAVAPAESAAPSSAPTIAAAPPAPVTKPGKPAAASPDYIALVTQRWHGCFVKAGVGDLYYDDVTSTVAGGPVSWTVGPGNESGTPADAASQAALAGC